MSIFAMADDQYSKDETQRRTEAALRAAFNRPHKTYEESKVGKRRAKPSGSHSKRTALKKSKE
jgi:hypothetical protein